MKIVVLTYADDHSDIYRKFCIKPDSGNELQEANQDVVSFLIESFLDLKEEGEE